MCIGAGAGHVVRFLPVLAPAHAGGIRARFGRDVGFDSDDRLDAGLLRFAVEVRGAVHIAVVGHPHSGHPESRCLGEQGLDLRHPVQHREFGVVVQVHESFTRHARPFRSLVAAHPYS